MNALRLGRSAVLWECGCQDNRGTCAGNMCPRLLQLCDHSCESFKVLVEFTNKTEGLVPTLKELHFIFGCKIYMYKAGGEATQILIGDEVDLHRELSLQL